MSEEKNCDSQCGGCNKKEEKPRMWGEFLADSAIKSMVEGTKDFPREDYGEDDVEEFLRTCFKRKKNPIEVVQYLADAEKIEIYDDSEPKDAEKARIWSFLRVVLKVVVKSFLAYLIDEAGLGKGSLVWEFVNMINNPGEDRRREIVVPVSLKYAFKF